MNLIYKIINKIFKTKYCSHKYIYFYKILIPEKPIWVKEYIAECKYCNHKLCSSKVYKKRLKHYIKNYDKTN